MHALVYVRLLVLVAALGIPGVRAGEAGGPVEAAVAAFQSARDGAVAAYQAGLDGLSGAYDAETGKAREKALSGLAALARKETRKEDKSFAIAAWKEVLRLDLQQADAVGFFTAMGTIDAVSSEISASPASYDVLTGSVSANGAPLPDAVGALLKPLLDAKDKAGAAFTKGEAALRAKFTDAETKLRARATTQFISVAKKAEAKGDLPTAAKAWTWVLALTPGREEAVAFFTGLGTLAQATAEAETLIPPALGDPPVPGAGFAPMSLQGLRVVFIGSLVGGKPGGAGALICDRLTQAGASVSSIGIGLDWRMQERLATPPMADAQLVIMTDVSDATSGTAKALFRECPCPMIVLGGWHFSQIIRPGWAGGYADSLEVQMPAHPAAGGLSKLVRILPELPPPAKAVPVEEDPRLGQVAAYTLFGPSMDVNGHKASLPLAPGTVSIIASLPGKPNSMVVFAIEKGAPRLDGVAADGSPVTSKTTARLVGFTAFTMTPDKQAKLTREFWRLWDASLMWAIRGR